MSQFFLQTKPPRRDLPRIGRVGGLASLLLGSVLLLSWFGTDIVRLGRVATDDTFAGLIPPKANFSARLSAWSKNTPPAPLPTGLPTAARILTIPVTVGRGDTLSRLFERHGIRVSDAYRIADISEAGVLKNIRPGKTLIVSIDTIGRLHRLSYPLAADRSLIVMREIEPDFHNFTTLEEVRTTTRSQHLATGEIRSTLYQAGRQAGMTPAMLKQLQVVFGGLVDFNRDLRPGDTFRVFYDTEELDGKRLRDGHLLAAELVLQGDRLEAFRYVNEAGDPGYYDSQGTSVETAFQRSPLPLARVSSGYSKRRFHPILKVWRRHEGVDYAAPTGTPVSATGHGRVKYVGWQRGYGKVVILQHADGYSTLYGHLSRFAKGLKRGKRVRRGEIIAYVGNTGWSTGPHLHYEFRENGRHRDPQSISLPPSKPVPDDQRPAFAKTVNEYLAGLDPEAPRAVALSAEAGN